MTSNSAETHRLLVQAQGQLIDWIEKLLKSGMPAHQIVNVIRSTIPMIHDRTLPISNADRDLQNLKVSIAGLDLDGF